MATRREIFKGLIEQRHLELEGIAKDMDFLLNIINGNRNRKRRYNEYSSEDK